MIYRIVLQIVGLVFCGRIIFLVLPETSKALTIPSIVVLAAAAIINEFRENNWSI